MLAETVDAGLLRATAEQMNDERILMQIRGKDYVALEVRYHKVCYSNYTKFLARATRQRTRNPRHHHKCIQDLTRCSAKI